MGGEGERQQWEEKESAPAQPLRAAAVAKRLAGSPAARMPLSVVRHSSHRPCVASALMIAAYVMAETPPSGGAA